MNDHIWFRDQMTENQNFDKQAKTIHDIHIRQEQSADMQIAEKRINQYFEGILQLSWKSIIYEINKLPELDRNKYFIKLCERETLNAQETAIKKTYEEIMPVVKNYKKAWKTLLFSNLFLLATIIFLTLKGV